MEGQSWKQNNDSGYIQGNRRKYRGSLNQNERKTVNAWEKRNDKR